MAKWNVDIQMFYLCARRAPVVVSILIFEFHMAYCTAIVPLMPRSLCPDTEQINV
jgi:hypothetical protein